MDTGAYESLSLEEIIALYKVLGMLGLGERDAVRLCRIGAMLCRAILESQFSNEMSPGARSSYPFLWCE
jgi:hypothetical protein